MQEDINSKDFSEEENSIYRKSIDMIRSNVNSGVKFDLACEFIAVADRELKELIIDDALKIEIAELHYGKQIPLIEVSKKLGVGMDRLMKASDEMMEDIINTASGISVNKPGSPDMTTH